MEILVFMDETDKQRWFDITEMYKKTLKDQSLASELKKETAFFWHDMIEKYPVLRNKQLHVDQVKGAILSWTSVGELKRK